MVPGMRHLLELPDLRYNSSAVPNQCTSSDQRAATPMTSVGRIAMTPLALDVEARIAAAQELLDTHQPQYTGGVGRCTACGVAELCGPYEIATAVFAGTGKLPQRRPFASLIHISSAGSWPRSPIPTTVGLGEIVKAALSDVHAELVTAAIRLLAEHQSDEYGLCAGCMGWWGRYIPYNDCANARWAAQVIETHGVADPASPVPQRETSRLAVPPLPHTTDAARSATCPDRDARHLPAAGPAGEVTGCEKTGGSVGAIRRPADSPPRTAPAGAADARAGGDRMGNPDEGPIEDDTNTADEDAQIA